MEHHGNSFKDRNNKKGKEGQEKIALLSPDEKK